MGIRVKIFFSENIDGGDFSMENPKFTLFISTQKLAVKKNLNYFGIGIAFSCRVKRSFFFTFFNVSDNLFS